MSIPEEVKQTVAYLKKGQLILYPTDTVWGIGCDATNPDAVKKIYQLKQRIDSKALICLVADEHMLKKHIPKVPQIAFDILAYGETPTTVIYNNPQGLAHNLVATDQSIAIRVPDDEFCHQLLQHFDAPIVSTSANISGHPTPNSFKEISDDILKGVDYVVNLHRDKKGSKPSSIIKLDADGTQTIIRK